MKSLSILTVLLLFIIVIAQATPVQHTEEIAKRELGSKVVPLGVRFKDLYQRFNNQLKKVNKKFDHEITKFNKVVPEAAKSDNTDAKSVQWLLNWNADYEKLVSESKANTAKLDESIATLAKRLSSQ